jgi:tetratricopeptide (TPR) repeat protein
LLLSVALLGKVTGWVVVGWASGEPWAWEFAVAWHVLLVGLVDALALRLLRRAVARQRQIHTAIMYADDSLLPPGEAERRRREQEKLEAMGSYTRLKKNFYKATEALRLRIFWRLPPATAANLFRHGEVRPGPDHRLWIALASKKNLERGQEAMPPYKPHAKRWYLKEQYELDLLGDDPDPVWRRFFRAIQDSIADSIGKIPYIGPKCCGSRMARKYVRQGDAAFEEQRYPAATHGYQKALAVGPEAKAFDSAVVINRLGCCCLAMGQDILALRHFDEAVLAAEEQCFFSDNGAPRHACQAPR